MHSVYNKPLDEISPEELKHLVGKEYGLVATCPSDKHGFPTGRSFALAVGYPKEELDKLPSSLVDSFAGVSYPLSFQEMKAGDIVLDIGCGVGLDLYFASKKVGPLGKVHGIDISEEMVNKSRKNMKKAKLNNVEIIQAHSDDLPLADKSVDVITSNGIYNLSPDKKAVLKEAYRILKLDGVISFSEIVLEKELEKETRKSVGDWFQCIGGALTLVEFISLMEEVGFNTVEVLSMYKNARCGHEYARVATIRAVKSSKIKFQDE